MNINVVAIGGRVMDKDATKEIPGEPWYIEFSLGILFRDSRRIVQVMSFDPATVKFCQNYLDIGAEAVVEGWLTVDPEDGQTKVVANHVHFGGHCEPSRRPVAQGVADDEVPS